MLNSSVRRDALERLKKSVEEHEQVRKAAMEASEGLFSQRRRASTDVIAQVEDYVNTLANSPKEFDKTVERFRVEARRFDSQVQQLAERAAQSTTVGRATGTAGAVAGLGVAALGPSVAMAVATTFGAASTGTAISVLSGAAATKAGRRRIGRRWRRDCRRKSTAGPCGSRRVDGRWSGLSRFGGISALPKQETRRRGWPTAH